MADEKKKDCNVESCVMFNEIGDEKCNCFKPEEVNTCKMYQVWNVRKKEVKRLCRRILVEAEYIITAKEELNNMTSGNFTHKIGSTQWKLTCVSKKLKSHVEWYKKKIALNTEGNVE